MKILLLHYSAPPVVGGVEHVLGQHARLMAEAGHQVHVVAGRGEQFDLRVPFHRMPLADSVNPDILSVKARLDSGIVPAVFDELAEKLAAGLMDLADGADCLVAHNVCSLAKNLPLAAALHKCSKLPGFPHLVLWHHDLAWMAPRYQHELHVGYPWDLLRTDWPGATQVTISEQRRMELAGLLQVDPDRIRVIPNGVEPAEFLKLEAQTQEFIWAFDLFQARPLFVLPVRITPRKNIELALRVLAALRAVSFPQAALLISGPLGSHNPANQQYFEQLVSLRRQLGLEHAAHFLTDWAGENLPGAVVGDLYRIADALLLPSLEEGFGMPLMEAGLAGLPVFCSDLPSLRELGGDQAHYFSTRAAPQDVAAMISQNLSGSPGFQMRYRTRSRYTWQRIYQEKIRPLLETIEVASPALDSSPVASGSAARPLHNLTSQMVAAEVDHWFSTHTFQAGQFADLDWLLQQKRDQNLTISLVLPTLNVAASIGAILCSVKENLVECVPLLDEVVVMDSNSQDGTRAIVEDLGLPVYIHQNILPQYGSRPGKGEAIWKSLFVTHGDLVCWIDSDILNFSPHFVYGLIGPLLEHPGIQYVKGFYRRPILIDGQIIPTGGGRVTELCARPLLNLFYPQLAGIIQPLSGEYCGRRSTLETLPFSSGYAVEAGLLIDILNSAGLDSVAQVDLHERIHQNRPLESLSTMSFSIIQAVLSRVDARWGTDIMKRTRNQLTQVHNQPRNLFLYTSQVDQHHRPPALSLPEYQGA